MVQKVFNQGIVMSLLRQCAWVWEHCTNNPHEGEFKLSEILQGYGRNGYKSKPGTVIVSVDDSNEMVSRMVFPKDDGHDFVMSFPIEHVYGVTQMFGKNNACQSLVNKACFCYKNGERWVVLPDVVTKRSQAAPSFAELLRKVLLAA